MIESSNPDIFCGLIDLSAELNMVLKNRLQSASVLKITSKTIQDEVLEVMLHVCYDKISEEIRETKFYQLL